MEFTQEELRALRAEFGKGFTDTQWEWVVSECRARNLRLGVHLVPQIRRAKEYDPDTNAYAYVGKPFLITTIAALRLIAQRTGEYLGQAPEEYVYLDDKNLPTVVSNVPLPDPTNPVLAREPWVVRTKVFRKGFQEPMVGVARFEAYAGTMKGSDNKIRLTDMWSKRGSEQLCKCSEALSLRKAFPEEMGSLFLAEELKHEEEPAPPPELRPLNPAPAAPVVPVVNQVPAEPTSAPRPNEPQPTLAEIILHKPEVKPKKAKKSEPIPDNGKPEIGITDADFDTIGKEIPEFDEAANRKEAEAFAEDVCSAAPVSEIMPDDTQKKAYTARIRKLVADHKVDSKALGIYVVTTLSKKETSGELTVANWEAAFEKLDAAAAAGTLKELVKP